jgi:hypothetical protein
VIPYYQDDNCTIYHADCGDVLSALDRFDLLLTKAPQYPPGLTDDNKARMDSGLGLAGQSNRPGALPEAQLLKAISIADNSIVWRTGRYRLPEGRTLEWSCSHGHVSSAWHNISAPRIMSWGLVPESDRLRLFKQCIQFTPQANTILDPFMDTGDVLIAAIILRRRFVGIEIDQQRCDQAISRIPARK